MEYIQIEPVVSELIAESLSLAADRRPYYIARRLTAIFPNRAVIECSDGSFDVDEFVKGGHCTVSLRDDIFQHATWQYYDSTHGPYESSEDVWYTVDWQGHSLEVVTITWFEGHCRNQHHWVVGDSKETAVAFYKAVGDWVSEVRGEVLVFDAGHWHKSERLFEEIKSTTFENLILPPVLVQEMQDDFAHFLRSRDLYDRYGIPWKRGVLLTGPPGNGKTHTVKALVNWLGVASLYVKSLTAQYRTPQDNIRAVFERARSTTPCVLIFEDLDSLIDDQNRSFFLNELDGFAANTGVIVLATTNHPERLDPALVDRPSRFDRKYQFELPADAERLAYIEMWNRTLDAELRANAEVLDTVVSATDGFSFAYLKELFLSAMMRWITTTERRAMIDVLLEQSQMLRTQMHAMNEPAPPPSSENGFDPDMMAMMRMMSRGM